MYRDAADYRGQNKTNTANQIDVRLRWSSRNCENKNYSRHDQQVHSFYAAMQTEHFCPLYCRGITCHQQTGESNKDKSIRRLTVN